MRDSGEVYPQALGHCGIGLTRIDPAANEACEVERRQCMALHVLGDLRVGVRWRITKNHRGFLQANALRGKPTPGPKVNLMSAFSVGRVHNDGLQDAVLAYVFSQLIQLGLGDFSARVVRVSEQLGQRQHQGLPSLVARQR
jgi:hypothetical protein